MSVTVICQRRGFITSNVVNPYLYQFDDGGTPIHDTLGDTAVPSKFLRIPSTKYYEYGGTHEEALQELTNTGFSDIIEGDEL